MSECWNWDTNIHKLQYRQTSSQFSCLIKCHDFKSRESCCMNQECFPPKILWFLKLEELQALQSECHDKSLRKLNMQCLEFISYMAWTSSENCLKVLAYYRWLLLLSLRITAVLSYGERAGWKYEIARLTPRKTDCSWSLFWMFLLAWVFWYLDLCCLHNKQ